MIFKDMEFFNVEELTEVEHLAGFRMNRFPQNVSETFERKTPVSFSRGCEIRFVLKDGMVTLYLMAVDEDGEVIIFFGDYECNKVFLHKGVVTPVNIAYPELLKNDFTMLSTKKRFSKNLCRVFFNNKAIVHYIALDTYHFPVAPPKADDLPTAMWLAYGSSITHGASAGSNSNSYIQQCARLLNSQVRNLGMSGSCCCEKEVADYIAQQVGLDFVFLELGVNMRSAYTPEEFEKHAKYFIETVASKQKQVFVTTIYPNRHTYFIESPVSENEVLFNKILRQIVKESIFNNIHLIEGNELLTNFTSLATDLIHPSDSGHIEIAYNLYNEIKNVIF